MTFIYLKYSIPIDKIIPRITYKVRTLKDKLYCTTKVRTSLKPENTTESDNQSTTGLGGDHFPHYNHIV